MCILHAAVVDLDPIVRMCTVYLVKRTNIS